VHFSGVDAAKDGISSLREIVENGVAYRIYEDAARGNVRGSDHRSRAGAIYRAQVDLVMKGGVFVKSEGLELG